MAGCGVVVDSFDPIEQIIPILNLGGILKLPGNVDQNRVSCGHSGR
jgi:hypothetical protein